MSRWEYKLIYSHITSRPVQWLCCGILIHVGFGILGNSFLEEVGLSLQGYHFHEIEGVGGIVELVVSKGDQKSIGHEFNVLLH